MHRGKHAVYESTQGDHLWRNARRRLRIPADGAKHKLHCEICMAAACAFSAFIPALQILGLPLRLQLRMTAFGIPWLVVSALAWGLLAYGAGFRRWDLRGKRGLALHFALPLLLWDGLWMTYRVYPAAGLAVMLVLVPVALAACQKGSDDRQKPGRKTARRIVSNAAVLIFFLGIPALLLWDFGVTETVSVFPSPFDRRTAEVWNVDEGALGGSTLVMVGTPERHVPLLLGTLEDRPRQVYRGVWGEFETMKIEWRDENTLLIDGHEYPADGFTDRKNGGR